MGRAPLPAPIWPTRGDVVAGRARLRFDQAPLASIRPWSPCDVSSVPRVAIRPATALRPRPGGRRCRATRDLTIRSPACALGTGGIYSPFHAII